MCVGRVDDSVCRFENRSLSPGNNVYMLLFFMKPYEGVRHVSWVKGPENTFSLTVSNGLLPKCGRFDYFF